MRWCKYLTVVFLGLLFNVAVAEENRADRVVIEYFYQIGCHECDKVAAFVLPPLAEKYAERYELRRYDTSDKDSFLRLVNYQERFNPDADYPVCMILNGRIFLGGYSTIKARLFAEIDRCLASGLPTAEMFDIAEDEQLRQRGKNFTLAAVLVAGLIDGINPCVFSTLIFFLTLLMTLHIGKAKLLLTGGVYCLACFFTYLALGFGIFRFLHTFSGFPILQKVLTVVLLLGLVLLAVFSFVDAWRYWQNGRVETVMLQLPLRIKTLMHRIMRYGVRYHYLLPGVFVVGMLVTVLESVCSGQVYVPTLIMLARENPADAKWLGYLLLYNLMFILPLVGLFFAVSGGASVTKLLTWGKREMVIGKVLLGLFFLFLAVIVLMV